MICLLAVKRSATVKLVLTIQGDWWEVWERKVRDLGRRGADKLHDHGRKRIRNISVPIGLRLSKELQPLLHCRANSYPLGPNATAHRGTTPRLGLAVRVGKPLSQSLGPRPIFPNRLCDAPLQAASL